MKTLIFFPSRYTVSNVYFDFLEHKNIKAFVTHGGLMSTTESIYAGVPLVGIPIFGDQSRNVQLQVKRKIAKLLELDSITENSLTSAIKEVIQDPDYK